MLVLAHDCGGYLELMYTHEAFPVTADGRVDLFDDDDQAMLRRDLMALMLGSESQLGSQSGFL